MSDDSKNIDSDDGKNTSLGVQEAFGNVFHGVHKRAFFHRLAQHGHVPQSDQEAQELLDMGAKVATASTNPVLQQAAAKESRFTKANAALNDALAERGLLLPAQKQADGQSDLSLEAQAAAWELAQDSLLFKSAEVLQAERESEPAAAKTT